MSAVRPEKVFTGLAVSHGVAIGPAYLVQVDHPKVPVYDVSADGIAAELDRFENAVTQAVDELSLLKQKSAKLPDEAAEEVAVLLDAHAAMLDNSRLVRGVKKRIETERINAEQAVENEVAALESHFATLKDSYIAARMEDVRAVGNRLLRILMELPWLSLDAVPAGGLVLAREITPADTALLDPRVFGGIATVYGGAAGHTAVMARGLGLPAVLGISEDMIESVHHGDMAIVDGTKGVLILNPSEKTLFAYQQQVEAGEAEKRELSALLQKPAVTKDGTAVHLYANIETPREIADVLASGAEGVGLFRTEFMYMNRDTLPDEEEQFDVLFDIVSQMKGKPVTVRTLDIGGDKIARALGQYMGEAVNPALGLRAIRLSLKYPHLLQTQFAAILRAAAFGDMRILLPMVSTTEEVVAARRLLKETYESLKEKGVQVPENLPPIGTMIEIPAAALAADTLAAVSDFFALGTNDLIQYTVAIDRGNDQVATLYNPLNPAVLRMIEFTVQAARRAEIPVSLCGEMASDTLYTPILLGLGLVDLSMGYASLPRVKRRVRELDMEDVARLTDQVMRQFDPKQITRLVDNFAQQG